jgi:TolA-binding protein
MGNHRYLEKIVGVILVIVGICAMVYGQGLRDAPIVSDEKVVVQADSSISVVTKDEQQRIVDKQIERIQRLENRVSLLEHKINRLEEQGE